MSHYYQHEGRVYPSVTTILQSCRGESPGDRGGPSCENPTLM